MKAIHLLALCVLLSACGATSTAGNNQPSPTPSEVASPGPAASPTNSPSPLAFPTTVPVCATIQGGTSARATITDVRVGMHLGYDRLVIEFAGGLPTYKVVSQDPSTFVGPASGLPVKVAGKAGYHVYIYNMDIPPTYPLGNIITAYPELKQVVVMAVFEGQADIAAGLDHPACPAVTTLSGPSRLVIDFPS